MLTPGNLTAASQAHSQGRCRRVSPSARTPPARCGARSICHGVNCRPARARVRVARLARKSAGMPAGARRGIGERGTGREASKAAAARSEGRQPRVSRRPPRTPPPAHAGHAFSAAAKDPRPTAGRKATGAHACRRHSTPGARRPSRARSSGSGLCGYYEAGWPRRTAGIIRQRWRRGSGSTHRVARHPPRSRSVWNPCFQHARLQLAVAGRNPRLEVRPCVSITS